MQFTILTLILFMNLINEYVVATGIALGYMYHVDLSNP